jgi:hypothetical protein
VAGSRHRFERKITLTSARAMRAGAGRPSTQFRRHRLRTMVAALRNARRQVTKGQQHGGARNAGKGYRSSLPLSLRMRRAVANTRAWLARRFR